MPILIILTDENDSPFYLNASKLITMYAIKGGKTRIYFEGGSTAVKGTPEQIDNLICERLKHMKMPVVMA